MIKKRGTQHMEFTRSIDLALYLRKNIDSQISGTPIEGSNVIHTWESLVQFLGDFFLEPKNRKLAIDGNGFTKVMHAKLREKRIALLIKALKAYDPERYTNF